MAKQITIPFDSPAAAAGVHFPDIVSKWDDEKLQKELSAYERLVRIHEGKEPPTVNPITKKEFYHQPMTWMLPAYRSGLEIIQAEIARRKEVSNA